MGNRAAEIRRKDPARWERIVFAAALIGSGATIKEAAESVDANPRTVTRWKAADFWPDAIEEACEHRLRGLAKAVLGALQRILAADEPDPATVRWAAERLFPELTEPPQRHEVAVAGRIQHEAKDPRVVLAERLNEIEARQERALPPAESEPE